MKKNPVSCLRWRTWLAGFVLMAVALLETQAQNLLLNPSFDDPGPGGWAFFGGADILDRFPNRSPSESYDGKKSLHSPADITGSSSGAMQTVAATAGGQMIFSGFVLNSIHNELRPGCYGLSRIEFLDSDGGVLSKVDSQKLARGTGDWVPFSIQGIAPEGSIEARLSVLLWKGPLTDAYGMLYFDALNAQEITSAPEPHVWLAALSVIGCAIGLRRRR